MIVDVLELMCASRILQNGNVGYVLNIEHLLNVRKLPAEIQMFAYAIPFLFL
jgi:hypothetical protein